MVNGPPSPPAGTRFGGGSSDGAAATMEEGKETAFRGSEVAFEQFLNGGEDQKRPRKWRFLTLSLSIVFHAGLGVAALIHSFWHVDELQPPGMQVTFMTSRLLPPPPPPAAIAKKTAPVKPRAVPTVKPKVAALVQPTVIKPEPAPSEEAPEKSSDEGTAGGSSDGVVGGAVAEAPPAPPPPPPKPREDPRPIMLPPNVGQGYRLTDINDPRYRPNLPPALRRAGMMVWGMFRICVSIEGHVSDVRVLKSADALVDDDWTATIRRWEYRPYSLDGRTIPFCHAARITVTAQL
jgi:hypothetical protein